MSSSSRSHMHGRILWCSNCDEFIWAEEWITYKDQAPKVKRFLCSVCYLVLNREVVDELHQSVRS